MANMIKFYRGLVGSLPTTGENGALYITTDEGAIYYGTGTGMKRLGDFVQVDNVASLPEKAHESCLYYCVAENILAKWNGTEWKQINKQPTAEEMKTLLGLGSMAYKSEVAEGDLNADLKAKVNAAAEGNHSHANKALLDTYTQTEADLADAVAKKHSHANADELAKIVDGDKAKWDAVAADHLTSADKTTLENSIKEAKKAGTDANTNIETYKVSNDARVLAVEEDIAEITDGTNGILAQAKGYSDGKLATARTEISAEIDADVKVVADDLAGYKTSNDTALAGVKATAEAAAVKTEVESALAGKVDKVDGKDLIATSEIERLATLHNYDDTQVKADIAKKADAEAMNTELGKKVDKVEGYSLVSDTEIARLAEVDNYDDEEVRGLIGDNAKAIEDLEAYVGTIPADYTETNVISYINKKAEETLAAAQGGSSETAASVKQQLDNYKSENDTRVKAAEDAIDAIEADYLKAADKTELSDAIAAINNEETGVLAQAKEYADGLAGNYDAAGSADDALEAAKAYTDEVKAGILGEGITETFDTLKEIEDWINKQGGSTVELTKALAAETKAREDADSAINEVIATLATQEDLEEALGKIDAILGDNEDVKSFDDVVDEINAIRGDYDGSLSNLYGEISLQCETLRSELNTEIFNATESVRSDLSEDITNATEPIYTEISNGLENLRSELEEDITANTEAIATKANAADVYTKTEVYTQAEVDALISAAHTWGEF